MIFLLAAVDDDIFRLNPFLVHALFGMVTTATEKTWRLYFEIAHLFTMTIDGAEAILLKKFFILVFIGLKVITFNKRSEMISLNTMSLFSIALIL